MAKLRQQSKSAPKGRGRPPEAELEVLACLWQRGSATARHIREMMENYRPMTHGSMVTLLKRLEAKGMVTHAKAPKGKAFLYRATRSARPTHRRIIRDIVQRIFGGNGVQMVSTFLDSKPPTPEELDQIQGLLDGLRADSNNHRENSQ